MIYGKYLGAWNNFKGFYQVLFYINKMDQDESNCMPYGILLIDSSSNGQFSTNIKHKRSHLSHYFPSIYTSRWTRLFMGNTYEPKRNFEGLFSGKRDSAVSWNKMNLLYLVEILPFTLQGSLATEAARGKWSIVSRKFWQTNCKPFKIVQEKWDYILNLHTYILSYITLSLKLDHEKIQNQEL